MPSSGFTVILVNFHSLNALRSCVGPLRRFFAGRDVEYVLVDNSPGDGSAEFYEASVPNGKRVVPGKNVGFAAAVNLGFAASSNQLVLLVNPDIESIQGTPESVARIFEEDDKVAAVGVRFENPDGSLQYSCKRTPTPLRIAYENLAMSGRFPHVGRFREYRMLDDDYSAVMIVHSVCGGFLFVDRDAFERLGPFDERFFVYYEEVDWMERARAAGYATVFTPEVVVTHRAGTSSEGAEEDVPLLLIESQQAYVRKHFGLIAQMGLGAMLVGQFLWRALRATLPRTGSSTHRHADINAIRVLMGATRKRPE
ncbi:MAG: glycosyltransferase family 2 protein [Actinomycetota bacterium]|nr:glycosyltransferase family 2 protein [Actinomycetota bacterium]